MKLRIDGGMSAANRSDSTVSFRLRVEDDASGELLGSVTLTADQWMRLTSGTSLTVEGDVSPHLDRVGRKMVVRQLAIPRDAVTPYVREQAAIDARAWARQQAEDGETTEVRQTNSGWVAIYRSWPEA